MTPELIARWDAFIEAHPNSQSIIGKEGEEKIAMFRHGWDNPDRNVDDYHEALWAWRTQVLEDTSMLEPLSVTMGKGFEF